MKSEKGNLDLKLTLARFYITENKNDKATKIFQELSTNSQNNLLNVQKTYKAFISINQLSWAKKLWKKQKKEIKQELI